MDYQTKPTSRNDLRQYGKIFRELFNVPEAGPFPVLEALELLADVFPNCNYIIVEDGALPYQTMAQCSQNEAGGYTIEIKETIYRGAYEDEVGAFLGFICHELCHIFLFYIGFRPIFARSFANNELPAYCSVEWQAKALCAEVMIPFDESSGMKPAELMKRYHVSRAFAVKRYKLDKKKHHI